MGFSLEQQVPFVREIPMPDEMEDSTNDRLKAEWVIHAPLGGSVKLTARHDRAGVVRTELKLGGDNPI